MPESAPPSAKSCRFHSAVRNRRWQAITAVGAGLIVAVWVFSLCSPLDVNVPIQKRKSVWVRLQPSRLDIYLITYTSWHHHFKIDSDVFPIKRGFRVSDGVERAWPGFESGIEGFGVRIPYWLLLVAFLAIQYALLPKSRPVWKSGD